MGGLCCCPCGDEFEEYSLPSNPLYRHCICLQFFFHQLFTGYSTRFQRLEEHSVSSPMQGATALTLSSGMTSTLAENSLNDRQLSISMPLPYDAEQRYSRPQRDGLVSRREKSMTHLQEDSQMRRNISGSGSESLGFGKKRHGVDPEEGCKSTKVAYGLICMQPSSEDEDVCPTCLDEYTPENPKITTRCSHHFHLGCIYEWLERSESCPICGKETEFCERSLIVLQTSMQKREYTYEAAVISCKTKYIYSYVCMRSDLVYTYTGLHRGNGLFILWDYLIVS